MTDWLPLESFACQAYPDRAIMADDAGCNHAALRRRIDHWRRAFAGVDGGDVALYFDDVYEFSAALYGAWHAGKRVYLCSDNLPATVQRLCSRVQALAGDFVAGEGLRVITAADEMDAVDAAPRLPLDPIATRLVVFTSGSTGEPAAIEKQLRQLSAEVQALQQALGAGLDAAVVHATVSHQHIYGLLFRVLWPLAAGRPLGARVFFPEDMVAALSQRDCVLVASPAHLKRLPAQLPWHSVHGRLKAVFSSGGVLPADAAGEAARFLGVPVHEIFGSSETGGVAWRCWDRGQPDWQPLPGVQWRSREGVLEVCSPHLPSADWWTCQDRVEAAGQGFRLVGRVDRIVKIEERRVSLSALEQQLQAHPQVSEARVFALRGPRTSLAAVVVAHDGHGGALPAAARRALIASLATHLSSSHDAVTRPRHWRLLDALPLNAQGKLSEAALEALFRPQQPAPQWRARGEQQADLSLWLDPALAVFDGHFPQVAILPGVAQLHWAIHFGRQAFALPPRFLRLEALKFQRVAHAGDTVQLHLEYQPARQSLGFRYVSEHGPHASGRVVFAEHG
ncbi:AMP-binding protein [Pseudoxanthomonas dokdonensis]|uniref:AMP-binding protein n=1 Tax=Pseudoxanthomonas dokdonensis TaxID=344882 RepID=A0A0R0CMK1_9GAMM|nr:AMP-binding protein [Pseudoxanthomonas dokdonensis]KRG71151.1 AMP-binding protein [Pseudoxanthomonas dokdonensis]